MQIRGLNFPFTFVKLDSNIGGRKYDPRIYYEGKLLDEWFKYRYQIRYCSPVIPAALQAEGDLIPFHI